LEFRRLSGLPAIVLFRMVNPNTLRWLRPTDGVSIGRTRQAADHMLAPLQRRRDQAEAAATAATADVHRLQSRLYARS
jgi:hypothetical protein